MFLDVTAASPHQLREKCILKPQLQKCGMKHIIGFQDNIATVQISICILTFTAMYSNLSIFCGEEWQKNLTDVVSADHLLS